MTSSMTYAFTIPLVPRGKGSVRSGTVHTKAGVDLHMQFKDRDTEVYMAVVTSCAAKVLGQTRLEGPLKIDIVAVFPRTKELLRLHGRGPSKGCPVHGAGRIWAPRKPDKDNIDKAIFDSLKAWLSDDCKVVCGDTPKVYCAMNEVPHVEVYISEPPPVDQFFFARGLPLPYDVTIGTESFRWRPTVRDEDLPDPPVLPGLFNAPPFTVPVTTKQSEEKEPTT